MGQTGSAAALRQVFNLLWARVVYLVPKASFILGRPEMTEPVERWVFTIYFHTELTVTSNKGQKLTWFNSKTQNLGCLLFHTLCLMPSLWWWWGQPDIPCRHLSSRLVTSKMPAQVHKSLLQTHPEGTSSWSCRPREREKTPSLFSRCFVQPLEHPPQWLSRSLGSGASRDPCLPVPWTNARASEQVLWSQRHLTGPRITHPAEIPCIRFLWKLWGFCLKKSHPHLT